MEEHLWTSSFWRLLSNCSDPRRLQILQKVILHKLGNKEYINDLNLPINNNTMQLPTEYNQTKQTILNPISDRLCKNNQNSQTTHMNSKKNKDNITNIRRAPVMGTNALLAKYKNCVQSEESKIIENLVCSKFNKELQKVNEICVDDNVLFLKENNVFSVSNLVMDNIRLSFDEEQFLEDALGDDVQSFTSTEYECPLNETEIKLEKIRPNLSISISSSRISSLISRATTVYSSIKSRVLRREKPLVECKPNSHAAIIDTEVGLLIQEASIQHQIMIEACKAINTCLLSKEFINGPEHIEAERILLLAMYKQNKVLKKMKQAQFMVEESSISTGFASVSHLTFPLMAKTQKEGYINWFVAIVGCHENVHITETILPNEDNILQFPIEYNFQNLQHDFEIDISIYSLLVKASLNNQTDSKETVTCLKTPDKLLCRRNSIKHRKNYCFERREPSFKLWGKTSVSMTDLERSTPFQLEQVPTGTTMKGFALLNFNAKVEFKENHSDFLTLRTECDNCMSWNHRWCSLVGHTFCYWNYPTDQDSLAPIGTINLQQCITSEISIVDRNLCARPRTLLVETAETNEAGVSFYRHFLSADNTEKMIFWKDCLNRVLRELIKWNLKCKIEMV